MKIKLIILTGISLFLFSLKSWTQETPKLAAFSMDKKAPENNSKNKVSEPVMATWGYEKNTNNSKKNGVIVPELKAYKKEKIAESNKDK